MVPTSSPPLWPLRSKVHDQAPLKVNRTTKKVWKPGLYIDSESTARREYSVNVVFKTAEAPGSLVFSFFLGSSDEVVGQVSTFGDPNQKPTGDALTNYTAPLTAALVDKKIALRPEDAVPALTSQLRWRIQQVCLYSSFSTSCFLALVHYFLVG